MRENELIHSWMAVETVLEPGLGLLHPTPLTLYQSPFINIHQLIRSFFPWNFPEKDLAVALENLPHQETL